jgi:hypothetical protein
MDAVEKMRNTSEDVVAVMNGRSIAGILSVQHVEYLLALKMAEVQKK